MTASGRAVRWRARASSALGAAAVLALVTWSLAPVLWQALTALKPDAQITHTPLVYLPRPLTWEHVTRLWERKPFGTYLLNSAWASGWATLLCVTVAALAAARVARMPGKGRDGLLLGLLVISLFPPILLLFPLYEGIRALGWVNHSLALILPYAALNLPLAVWVLESAFRQLPPALDEAARVDGLSALQRIALVHVPVALPAVATTAILVFIFCWNEFMLAVTFMTRDERKTVTAGIASVSGASVYEIPWGQLSAAVLIATLPLLLLVLLFQRRIVSGLTRGAVKG